MQAALASSVAYFLAIFLLGHERPFFAPIAAVDILRSTGMDQDSAIQALEEAAGRATEIE